MTAPSPRSQQPAAQIPCRLCGNPTNPLTTQLILNRHQAAYYRCPTCDLIQTEQPFWLDEAYSTAICASDTGAIARNELTARLTGAVAKILAIGNQARLLDFGGGHGVFVRMMRDRGLPFRWFDSHADNLFAGGFEGNPSEKWDFVTAFEVLEHLVDVSGELGRIFSSRPQAVLASTMLHRGHEPGWWYYGLHNGQHVAFYSHSTMQYIARRFGYRVAGSRAYTLFIRNECPISPWRIWLAEHLVSSSKGNAPAPWLGWIERVLPQLPSLTAADMQCPSAAAA